LKNNKIKNNHKNLGAGLQVVGQMSGGTFESGLNAISRTA
jgi:hypothetical protein